MKWKNKKIFQTTNQYYTIMMPYNNGPPPRYKLVQKHPMSLIDLP